MQINSTKIKKFVLNNLVYVIFAYAGNIICYSFRTAEDKDVSEKILPALNNLGKAFAHIIPSFYPIDLLIGIAVGVAMKFVMKMRAANKKKFRQGTEYGSAVWGTQKDIEPYMDLHNKDNNVILTQTEGLTMGKPSHPKYARNKNILVIGGSGSGKTRFFVKPNLMQMHSSYIVTDPKGTVLIECGKMFQKGRPYKNSKGSIYYEPYKIKVFNTIDFAKSMHYNPFAYISERNREKDILKFVDVLIKNTTSSQQSGGDDFWVKAEKLLYTSYIAMIFTLSPVDERNFETLIDMINMSECREDDETFKNNIDKQFEFVECWIAGKFPDDMELDKYYQHIKDDCPPSDEQKRLGAFVVKQHKLGGICKINGRIGFRGYTEADIITKEQGGVIAFIPTNIVDNQLSLDVKNTYITRFKYDESPEIMVKNGNILFVKTGSSLGKVHWFPIFQRMQL